MINNENNIDKNNNNMSSFEETIARMKGLYTYGKELNEDNNLRTHTLEYHAIGADGKSYGIIKECNKYYIKTAPQSKEMVAEAYDYIGGFCNKANYEYKSYANALKNFELKLASINEAYDGDVNISTLDPFKKEEYIVEGTRKMQDEIARCRQIMYNSAMIMNESIDGIGATKEGDVVKNNTKNQPEAPKGGKVDEITKGKPAKTPKENPSAGKSGNKPGKDGVFTEKPKGIKEGKCCEKCGEPSGKCTCGKNCNEESAYANGGTFKNTRYWDSDESTDGDQNISWVDGSENVNEEYNEWDEGLPNKAGIGTPNTSKNNNPFNKSKSINEEDEDFDFENDDESTDTDFDDGLHDQFNDEDDEFSDENGDEFDDEEDFSDENGDEFDDEENFSDENGEFDDEEDFSDENGEFDDEEDFSDENDEFGDEEDEFSVEYDDENGDEFNDEDFSDENDKFDDEEDFSDENDELGDEEDFSDENGEFDDEEDFSDENDKFDDEEDFSDENGDEFDDEENFSDENDEFDDEEDFSDENDFDDKQQMMESKRRKMNKIIESVTRRILKEDELHDFGKHPGYRKKPMELPSTGEDRNQWGRDWNDDSVYSEEPFGSKIGNGDPFTQLVNAVTKDVMYQLKKGIPIDGANKKKRIK